MRADPVGPLSNHHGYRTVTLRVTATRFAVAFGAPGFATLSAFKLARSGRVSHARARAGHNAAPFETRDSRKTVVPDLASVLL